MPWDQNTIEKYRTHVKNYIATYNSKIDCADLALAALVDFASENQCPVRLKYYSDGWKWFEYDPSSDDAAQYKNTVMNMLGALNIIDNTTSVPISMAKPGDFIMSKWSSRLGHTRIIYSVKFDPYEKKYRITWYQGNLPPVVPQRKTDNFSLIDGVYGNKPRRWTFEQFD